MPHQTRESRAADGQSSDRPERSLVQLYSQLLQICLQLCDVVDRVLLLDFVLHIHSFDYPF